MGWQADLKGAFMAADLLTAINSAFASASCPTIASGGILPGIECLPMYDSLPALAVTGPRWRQTDRFSWPAREATCEVTLHLAVGGADIADVLDKASIMGDLLRATVEEVLLVEPVQHIDCTGGDADGTPLTEDAAYPARLVTQTYEVVCHYDAAAA
jgi:hypothetical protein